MAATKQSNKGFMRVSGFRAESIEGRFVQAGQMRKEARTRDV